MTHRGFSHINLCTLDLEKTRAFYEGVLGFKAVVDDRIGIKEGGQVRHMMFDVGRDQKIAFLEPRGVYGLPSHIDTNIARALGVPTAFYHFAFEAGSEGALVSKHAELRAKGVEVTDIIDNDAAKSFYFKDTNGLSLEYSCAKRDLREDDIVNEVSGVPFVALDLGNAAIVETDALRAALRKAR